MAFSLIATDEMCSVRDHEKRDSVLMECAPPSLVADHVRSPPKKTPPISGTNRFSRHGKTRQLHATFTNRSLKFWAQQEGSSSTAAPSAASSNTYRGVPFSGLLSRNWVHAKCGAGCLRAEKPRWRIADHVAPVVNRARSKTGPKKPSYFRWRTEGELRTLIEVTKSPRAACLKADK
jgi:hypothetical protein